MNDGSLDIQDLTVRFGGLTALDDVTLIAVPKQVTGIIGPNGAGKTTLLNAVCGFVRPQAGRVRFDGKDLTRIRPHQLACLFRTGTSGGCASEAWRRWTGSARPTWPIACLRRWRTGRASGSRSPGRWPANHGCSCLTSLPAGYPMTSS